MKKLFSVLLALALALAMLAACGDSGSGSSSQPSQPQGGSSASQSASQPDASAPGETFTIAVAWYELNEQTQDRMKYLEEEIGPALGLEFIYSEAISDVDALLTFMENSYAAGADAVYSMVTNGVEAGAAKAQELGIYFSTQASTNYESVAGLEYNLGVCGMSTQLIGQAFGNVTEAALADIDAPNVILISGGASMGVASHRESTKAILEALRDMYGLTYDADVAELATVSATTDIATGTGMTLTVYPGFPNMENYIGGFSSLLQAGTYDAVVGVYPIYSVLSVAIDEVEKELGKNIKVIINAVFDDVSTAAFNTEDSTGDSCINAAVVNPNTAGDAINMVMLYNALTGHADLIKPDGTAAFWGISAFECADADAYNRLAKLDTSSDTYVITAEEARQLCAAYNPGVTYEDIQQALDGINTATLIEKRGL